MLPDILYDRRIRDIVIQAVFAVCVVAVLTTLIMLTRSHVDEKGILSTFSFLSSSTGWNISSPAIEYTTRDPYWYALLVGVANTLVLGVLGLILASFIGVVIGAARTSSNHVAKLLGTVYVEIFRNVPEILQVFFWYQVLIGLPTVRQAHKLGEWLFFSNRGLFLPWPNVEQTYIYAAIIILLLTFAGSVWLRLAKRTRKLPRNKRKWLLISWVGVGIVIAGIVVWAGHFSGTPLISVTTIKGLKVSGGLMIPPSFLAMIITLATFGGAYIGEIVRSGFIAVNKGQFEASEALGLNKRQTFFRISLPLAFRAMLPALTNRYVWLMKATTLGVAVGFADFFMTVTIAIDKVGHTIALITILMIGFLIINLSITVIMNKLNNAIKLRGNSGSA